MPVSTLNRDCVYMIKSESVQLMVPEAGIEPARLAAGDFLTTSAFAAVVLI